MNTESHMTREKIKSIDELSPLIDSHRGQGLKIVHCHGVFDLLHIGHIKYFQQAKTHGEVLVVTITSDAFVKKGPGRPAFTQRLRAEALAALEAVDYVAVNDAPSAVDAILAIKPDCYVKGKDYKDRPKSRSGNLTKEEDAVKKVGGELIYTDEELFSSSKIINSHFSSLPQAVKDYLHSVRKRYSVEEISEIFDKVAELKVLVIGETIIDEYHFCEAIGKSGKEPVLVTRQKSSERFGGGAVAIANNLAGFCKEVTILSCLGSTDSQEEFVRQGLRENVSATFLKLEGRPTIVKRRYVEHYLMQKLFEIYTIEDGPFSETEENPLLQALEDTIKDYDLVVVADYGHGMLGQRCRSKICSDAKFLAVNTQANAGNNGFHTISAYPRADYISISQNELCLEMRRRHGEVEEMIPVLRERVSCKRITVTKGKFGIYHWSDDQGLTHAPALTQHFVDRVGSGDAVLAATSPLAAIGTDPHLITFVGNLAGAEAVQTVGHRTFLTRSSFMKQVQALLK